MNHTTVTLLDQAENLTGTTQGFEALIRAVRGLHTDVANIQESLLRITPPITANFEEADRRLAKLENHAQVPEDVAGRFVRLEERLDRFELELIEARNSGAEDVKRLHAKIDGTKAILADLAKRVPEPKPDPVRSEFEAARAQRLANAANRYELKPNPPQEAGEFQALVCCSCHEVIGYDTTPTVAKAIVACPRCHRHLTSLVMNRKND